MKRRQLTWNAFKMTSVKIKQNDVSVLWHDRANNLLVGEPINIR